MKRIDLGQTIQILANLAVLAGIIFVAFELKEITLANKLDAVEAYTNHAMDLNRMLIEDPALYPALLKASGLRVDSNAEAGAIVGYERMRIAAWQADFFQFRSSALDNSFIKYLSLEVGLFMYADPMLRDALLLQKDYLDPDFFAFMEDNYEKMKANPPLSGSRRSQ